MMGSWVKLQGGEWLDDRWMSRWIDGEHSEPFRHEESVRLKHSERALNKVQGKLVAGSRAQTGL